MPEYQFVNFWDLKGKYFLTLSHSCNINYDFEKYSSIILATICQRFRHFNPSVCIPKYPFVNFWDPICNYFFSLTDSCNITHTLPPTSFTLKLQHTELGGYWYYTYPPPTSLTLKLQHIGWGVVLTLHIPTHLPLWLWNFNTLNWGGVVLTLHIPAHLPLWLWNFSTLDGGGIYITHTPSPHLPLWLWNFSTLDGGVVLTLHIPPTYLFDFESSVHWIERGGIDITHTHPPTSLTLKLQQLDGGWHLHYTYPPPTYLFDFETSADWIGRGWYWHYTHTPPTSLTWELQHTRLGAVLILHTQLCLWLWNFITLDGEWYWHYTYFPTYLFDFETSAHWMGGLVLTLHIPPTYLFDFETSAHWIERGVVLTLHIPPTYLFDFDTSAHWMGQWYWHYTYE